MRKPLKPTSLNAKKYPKSELSSTELSELDSLGLRSFVSEYSRLRKMVVEEDFSSQKTAQSLVRAQLAAVIRAIGIADKAFVNTGGRNAYAYVAVHTLARELLHDIQSMGDRSEAADHIRTAVLQPVLSSLVTEIVAAIISSRRTLNAKLSEKAANLVNVELQKLQESMTKTFVNAEVNASQRIIDAMEGSK